jgi:hypothetical protein
MSVIHSQEIPMSKNKESKTHKNDNNNTIIVKTKLSVAVKQPPRFGMDLATLSIFLLSSKED